jgi:hypothetical protein
MESQQVESQQVVYRHGGASRHVNQESGILHEQMPHFQHKFPAVQSTVIVGYSFLSFARAAAANLRCRAGVRTDNPGKASRRDTRHDVTNATISSSFGA